jgi:hypothetical protein
MERFNGVELSLEVTIGQQERHDSEHSIIDPVSCIFIANEVCASHLFNQI